MNRKLQYIYNLFIAMIVSALAVSCTDDELVKGGDKYEVVPDIPVALSLKIKVADQMEVQTRLAQSDETERTVNKLFVIAFKPSKQSDGAENADASDDECLWTILHFMILKMVWEILLK